MCWQTLRKTQGQALRKRAFFNQKCPEEAGHPQDPADKKPDVAPKSRPATIAGCVPLPGAPRVLWPSRPACSASCADPRPLAGRAARRRASARSRAAAPCCASRSWLALALAGCASSAKDQNPNGGLQPPVCTSLQGLGSGNRRLGSMHRMRMIDTTVISESECQPLALAGCASSAKDQNPNGGLEPTVWTSLQGLGSGKERDMCTAGGRWNVSCSCDGGHGADWR